MISRKPLFPAILICFVACLLSACTPKVIPPTNWTGEKEGLILHLKSAPNLNKIDGMTSTLYFVVYQLKTPNAFNQLTTNKEGLYKLLESNIFDPSVTAVKNIVIYPGSDVTYKIDRALDTRYMGVVAGYNAMEQGRMIRMFDIPVKTLSHGFFKKKIEVLADTLEISMQLGPDQIESSEIIKDNGVKE